jgi:hypothetical protein
MHSDELTKLVLALAVLLPYRTDSTEIVSQSDLLFFCRFIVPGERELAYLGSLGMMLSQYFAGHYDADDDQVDFVWEG